MATPKKKAAETIDYSMEEKIEALYRLQRIDTKIDEINKVKGELPLEVEDLENEVAGLQTRIENINGEVEELDALTKQRKEEIEQSTALITRYNEQLKNVRNNREYDSLNKEVEYQTLEIELNEKRLKEYAADIKAKKTAAEEAVAMCAERTIDLDQKRTELETIDKETAVEVAALKAEADQMRAKIDERLLSAYTRIRSNARNGLAVVTVRRDACGGCYNSIPPQRQYEVRQSRKVIVCEYCGRVLVSDEFGSEAGAAAT
ncbi:MAG: C4-type zinc ribbon domain-containing protein [Rikenellaceae bacterium]|nr:C4-type zinc ribbon domain-containing protein [Rikenellaceae bacterium]MCL2692802.1 C4-type zinc ribbon domain-containing protein [Rikenellaceae bacterium]